MRYRTRYIKIKKTKERYLKEKLNSSKLKPQYLIIDVQIDNPQVQKKKKGNLASNNKTPCGNYKQRVSNLADQYTESQAIITARHPKLEDNHEN